MTPGPGNQTRDTLVGGERSHHCAIPAPHEVNALSLKWFGLLTDSLHLGVLGDFTTAHQGEENEEKAKGKWRLSSSEKSGSSIFKGT